MSDSAFLLLAAGRSSRFDGTIRKQFAEINGKSVLRQSLERMPELKAGAIVVPPDEIDEVRERLASVQYSGEVTVVPGGETRRHSVRHGLESLSSDPIKEIIVHDAARPLTPTEVHRRVLDLLNSSIKGVVPVLPVDDTIKRVGKGPDESIVEETLNRSRLRRVQTPQAFDFEELLEVHRNWGDEPVTDDAMMLESSGSTVGTVPGSPMGRKITRREDLLILEELSNREFS